MQARGRAALLLAGLLGVGDLASAAGPAIDHKPVECIVAGQFPRLDACFEPQGELSRARVHFRAHDTTHWYFVDMAAAGGCRSVLLPKPLPSTRAIDYYVTALGRSFDETRTSDYTPRVVAREGDCDRDLLVAAGVGAGTVLLGAVAGAAATPPGFSSDGIVAAPSSSGGPQAKSGGGGGAAVVLGLAAAGAGGYLLYKQRSDDEPVVEPLPASPLDGSWTGTTSQQRALTFDVTSASLVRFDTVVDLGTSPNAPRAVPVQRTFAPGLPLTGGAFTFQHPADPTLTISGSLTSGGTAEGRIEGGRTVVSWTARRR